MIGDFTVWVFLVGIIQVALPIIAAHYSYVIYRHNRLAKAWSAVTVALILFAVNRIAALINEFNYLPEFTGHIKLIDQVFLPFFVGILLIWGLWTMKNHFETFDIIEKKIAQKAKLFGKKSVKKKSKRKKKK